VGEKGAREVGIYKSGDMSKEKRWRAHVREGSVLCLKMSLQRVASWE
jgi:hypothetical protein